MTDTIVIRLTQGPLGPAGTAAPPGAGAWVVFEGIVRPSEEGHPLAALVYEAYEPMTSRELHRLAREMLQEHGLLSIAVEHSVGRVAVGEVSFRLSVGSVHRAEAFRASDRFIAMMKGSTPLWKTPEFS